MVKRENERNETQGRKEDGKFKTYLKSVFGKNPSDIRCNVILYLITLIFLAVLIAPFVYVVTESFRSRQLVNGLPVEVWSFSAYKSVLGNSNIFRAYINTIVVTIVGTAVAVALTTVGAYPLSKKELPGRQAALIYVLITMLFSGGLIPFYILIRNVLQLTDSYFVYIAVGATGAFNIFVVKNLCGEKLFSGDPRGTERIRFFRRRGRTENLLFDLSAAFKADYRHGGVMGGCGQMERLYDGAFIH